MTIDDDYRRGECTAKTALCGSCCSMCLSTLVAAVAVVPMAAHTCRLLAACFRVCRGTTVRVVCGIVVDVAAVVAVEFGSSCVVDETVIGLFCFVRCLLVLGL